MEPRNESHNAGEKPFIGRPPLANRDKFRKSFTIRISDQERRKAERAAKTAGKSVTVYLRDAALRVTDEDIAAEKERKSAGK